MKYESSILKRLIDTYGVVGNPRYLSEIIKEFIVRGKELYPQLFTYQSDWLAHIDEFGLTPEYTVSYTGQHIYAPNTKEKPVKSAILKGSTKYRDIDTGEFLETFEEGRNLELVSVKIPVLYTIGSNIFDSSKVKDLDSNWKEPFEPTTQLIRCNPNTKYYYNGKSFDYIFLYDENKNTISSVQVWHQEGIKSFTTTSNCFFLGFQARKNGFDSINEHFISTNNYYEPYKSNILSTSEDVTLRGIGDVQDTLDCLTGEVTKNVSELEILNDLSKFSQSGTSNSETLVVICSIGNTSIRRNRNFLSTHEISKYATLLEWYGGLSFKFMLPRTDSRFADLGAFKNYMQENPFTYVRELEEDEKSIKTVGLTIHDKDQQKVERLTSFEGGTHFTTSSQDGSLLPTLTVDVVTDLEETLVVCSLEGNTM